MQPITENQMHLLHHTLGVTPERREPYRNYFVAGPGHDDQPDLQALEAAGLMQRGRTPGFCDPSDVVYRCTDAGRTCALDNLPPEPKRTKYDDYLHSESSLSFSEWLGINSPRVEWNHKFGKECRYRYMRRDWAYCQDVAGEWQPTKKDAKASYKEALAQARMNNAALPKSEAA